MHAVSISQVLALEHVVGKEEKGIVVVMEED
jgi:hypothetical protein